MNDIFNYYIVSWSKITPNKFGTKTCPKKKEKENY